MSRLTLVKFADWLRPLITSGARVVPGRIPDMPNRVIAIATGSGPGTEMEGLIDVIGIVITSRGAENNIGDAENIANEVDDVFLGKHPSTRSENFLIGTGADSVYVNALGRVGGGPSLLSIPDSQSRYSFTCSYYARVSTDIGTVFDG